MPDHKPGNLLGLTGDIATAHPSHNQLTAELLPSLIQFVYRALSTVDVPVLEPAFAHTPVVPVKKSVYPDFIVCLEDGKMLKMLKRHLQTSYRMTPADYRTRWGLPRDYPMVAPNYAATWSFLAKQIGLGRKATRPPTGPEITQLLARRARGSRT